MRQLIWIKAVCESCGGKGWRIYNYPIRRHVNLYGKEKWIKQRPAQSCRKCHGTGIVVKKIHFHYVKPRWRKFRIKKTPEEKRFTRKMWVKRNFEKVKAWILKWKENNLERVKKYNKDWNKKNPEKVKLYIDTWRNKNRDRVRLKSAERVRRFRNKKRKRWNEIQRKYHHSEKYLAYRRNYLKRRREFRKSTQIAS